MSLVSLSYEDEKALIHYLRNNVNDGEKVLSKSIPILSSLQLLALPLCLDEGLVIVLATIFPMLPSLQVLSLSCNKIGLKGAQALAASLPTLPSLQVLNLAKNCIDEDGARALANSLQKISSLQSLDWSDNRIGDDGARALAASLPMLPYLQSLRLENNKIGDGVIELTTSFPMLTSLQKLNLSSNNFSNDDIKALATSLLMLSSLQELCLAKNNIDNAGARALAISLPMHSSLQYLDLSENNIGGDGTRALAASLPLLSSLRKLYLYHNNIGADGASALATSLSLLSSLQDLNLSDNNIGADGASVLAGSLPLLSSLQILQLSRNKIGDGGARALAASLPLLSSMHTLYLLENNIGDVGARALATFLPETPSLQTLFLDWNNIGDNGVKALATSLPLLSSLRFLSLQGNEVSVLTQHEILFGLAQNSSLHSLEFPRTKASQQISATIIKECFAFNTTLTSARPSPSPSITWFTELNSACKKFNSSELQRNSVPKQLPLDNISKLLESLSASSEPWRKMKVVVLGHGQIGKTTLVTAIRKILDPLHIQEFREIQSTVGINCSQLKLESGEINIWDFGGQLEYTTTHGFFLSLKMILYLVCFDLSQPWEEQTRQITYWLDFLHSALPLPPISVQHRPRSDWGILIVGLRADKQHPTLSEQVQPEHIKVWQRLWPRLSILNNRAFAVSSITSEDSVRQLICYVEELCGRMFATYATAIPTMYRSTLQRIQHNPPSSELPLITKTALYADCGEGIDKWTFSSILQYLHAIGSIVCLKGGELICTDPQSIPKLAAKFVSPESVRQMLLRDNIQILNLRDIGCVMLMDKCEDLSLKNGIQLMVEFGICFPLNSIKGDDMPMFLFPSLCPVEASFKFSSPPQPEDIFCGIRMAAPNGIIFIPGFVCQLFVEIFAMLNIYRNDIILVRANGIVVRCPGLFDGDVIVTVDNSRKFIVIAIMATKPDVEIFSRCFHDLCRKSFPQ